MNIKTSTKEMHLIFDNTSIKHLITIIFSFVVKCY